MKPSDVWISNMYDAGWQDPNMTFLPGEGFTYRQPGASSKTITFIGEVVFNYTINSLPSGLSLRAPKFPRSGLISTMGFPIVTGDIVTVRAGGVNADHRYHNGIWFPSEPRIPTGDSFWIRKPTDWKQNANVWP